MILRIQGIFDSWGFSKTLLPRGPVYQVFSMQSGVIGLKLQAYLQLPSSPSRVGESGSGGTSLLPVSSGGFPLHVCVVISFYKDTSYIGLGPS